MKPIPTNWYVITGASASGKTSMIKRLIKKGHRGVFEIARTHIDNEMKKGLTLEEIRNDEIKFQWDVLKLKLKIEENLNNEDTVFLERGMPDSIAYHEVIGGDPEEMLRHCEKYRYKKIFFLEARPYSKDYARIEDEKTALKIGGEIYKCYKKLDYHIEIIPIMPTVEERVEVILSKI